MATPSPLAAGSRWTTCRLTTSRASSTLATALVVTTASMAIKLHGADGTPGELTLEELADETCCEYR
jgi:hypothetical protein